MEASKSIYKNAGKLRYTLMKNNLNYIYKTLINNTNKLEKIRIWNEFFSQYILFCDIYEGLEGWVG